jgi:hypothetical protein
MLARVVKVACARLSKNLWSGASAEMSPLFRVHFEVKQPSISLNL